MTKRVSIIGSSSSATTEPGWNDYEYQQFERSCLTAGVLTGVGNALQVTQKAAGANMTVDVKSGRALIEITNTNVAHGKTYKVYLDNDATVNVNITTAHGTYARIDRVVARVDVSVNPDGSAGNVAVIEVVPGTAAGSPSAPATPANAISLATVSVPANDTTITDDQITDTRTYVDPVTGAFPDVVRQASLTATNLRATNLENDLPSWMGTITGTDTLTGTTSPAISAYAAGQRFAFVVAATNTTAVTLNINSKGAKAVVRSDGAALVAGDLTTGGIAEVRYDGTKFILISTPGIALGKTTCKELVLNTTQSTTLTNPTSTTSFDTGQFTIAANDIVAGVKYEFDAVITISPFSSSYDLSVVPRLGTTDLFNNTTFKGSTISTNPLYVHGWFMGTTTAGSTSAVVCYMELRYGSTSNNTVASAMSVIASTNVATNAQKVFSIGMYFGTSNAGNSAYLSYSSLTKKSTSLFS